MSTVTRLVSKSNWDLNLEMENPGVDGQTVQPSEFNPAQVVYTPTSTPPASMYLAEEITGDSGTASVTIDLADFDDVEGIAKNATGLKVQEVRIQAAADNAAVVNVAPGDTNPYALFGSANDVDVPPAGLLHARFNDELADVASGAKNIKLTVGHGDVVSVEIILG